MAKHPHDATRPERAAIKKALAADDAEALYAALTVRQRRFAEEYVIDFIGSAAAIRAGYSPNYADRQAHVLLKNKGVARYVDNLTRSKEALIMSITPEFLIQRLMEVMNRPGIRTADELRAIEMSMKHLGMFVDKTEITGKDGGAIEVEQRKIEEDVLSFTQKLKMLSDRANKEKEVTLV
jgi:phage terminase small subunit